jgi:thiol-disulfide isomerase/thioredoxin
MGLNSSYILFTLLINSSILAQEYSLLDFQMENLKTHRLESFNQYLGKITLLNFFQPNCPNCKKQNQIMECLKTKNNELNIINIGIHGGQKELKKEIKINKVNFTSYEASSKFLREIGEIKGTPYVLVANKKGIFQTKVLGILTCEEWLKKLAQ